MLSNWAPCWRRATGPAAGPGGPPAWSNAASPSQITAASDVTSSSGGVQDLGSPAQMGLAYFYSQRLLENTLDWKRGRCRFPGLTNLTLNYPTGWSEVSFVPVFLPPLLDRLETRICLGPASRNGRLSYSGKSPSSQINIKI